MASGKARTIYRARCSIPHASQHGSTFRTVASWRTVSSDGSQRRFSHSHTSLRLRCGSSAAPTAAWLICRALRAALSLSARLIIIATQLATKLAWSAVAARFRLPICERLILSDRNQASDSSVSIPLLCALAQVVNCCAGFASPQARPPIRVSVQSCYRQGRC